MSMGLGLWGLQPRRRGCRGRTASSSRRYPLTTNMESEQASRLASFSGTYRRLPVSEFHFEPQLGELAREFVEIDPAGLRLARKAPERSIFSLI